MENDANFYKGFVENQVDLANNGEQGILNLSEYFIVKTDGELKKDTQTVFILDDKTKRYVYVHFSEDFGGFNIYMLKERCHDDMDMFMRNQ